MLVHLRIDPDGEGGWRILLRERDSRGVRGQLSAEAVTALLRAAHADLSGGAVVFLPGNDARQTQAEEALGRQLLGHLTGDAALGREWGRLLGISEGRDEPLLLVVDAEDQAIRALPWELLARMPEGAPLESGPGAVVRLTHGPVGRPPRTGPLQTWCWQAQPDDPSVAQIAAHLAATCAAQGWTAPLPVEAVTAAPADGPVVLHLISHGEVLADQLRLLGESALAAGTAVHLLSPLLPQVELVVLSICEGGQALPAELDGLAERLIVAGARAVVSAQGKLTTTAATAFISGLYGALGEGAALARAAAAGRRAVRALASPYPDARWHRLRLLVGDLSGAEAALLPPAAPGWPSGWPPPGPDALPHLSAALRLADTTGSGFVGIEHLALALAELPPVPGLEAVRYPLALRAAELRDGLSQLIPVPGREALLQLTPRLSALGEQLPPGFSLQQLWMLLLECAGETIQLLSSAAVAPARSLEEGATVQTWTTLSSHSLAPPDALEVLGGPEDGRRLQPTPGVALGRWSSPPRSELSLYAESRLTDPSLSRRHLIWWGGGRVQLLAPARERIRRGHVEHRLQGEQELAAGDLLRLSRATCLLAVQLDAPT